MTPALRGLVQAALKSEARSVGEIGVALADDTLLRALNRDYRGLDKATDVLSFGYDESGEVKPAAKVARGAGASAKKSSGKPAAEKVAPAVPVSGDLVISMDRVREQAKRFKVAEGVELARLVVHGALHLAGLDHQNPAERRAMRAREEAVLAACAGHVRLLAQKLKIAHA